ncbi:unnamed protein product [Closterium sp. NIES-54]
MGNIRLGAAGSAAGAGGAGGVTGSTGGAAGAGGAGPTTDRHCLSNYMLVFSLAIPVSSSSCGAQSPPQLLPGSSLPALAPHTEVIESLTERCEPETRASTPVRAHRVARPRPPAVPGPHGMALRPSSVPRRVALPEPPASSLPHVPDPESDLAPAASPTVTRLLATVVTDPELESTATFALVIELVDFAARSRLDYVASLVTESECVCPPSVGGEPALSNPDALDIPTPRSYAEAIAGGYSSEWQTPMDAEMASWKSTGTYIDEVPPLGANIVDGMWIFRVKRPTGSPPAFKARYIARGFRQRQGVDFFQTFSPTLKMTTLQAPREWHDTLRTTLTALGFAPSSTDPSLFLRTDTSLPPFYVLMYVNDLVFATADTEALALVKAELQERHTCFDLGELRRYLGLHITRDRARRTITLTQSHMVHQVLQRFGFQFSSPEPTPLSTGHSLSAPSSDESVEPSGPYPELVGCLVYLMTCTRPDPTYPLSLLARYVAPGRHRKATQRSSQGYTFSLDSGSVSWRSTSSSVLGSSCEAEIYAGAMAAQELRWLTYLLTNLGGRPRFPPVLYIDNKAMLALCHEQRLEHRTKHIALC